ncbi:MAG: PEP-CTERM sorting domain-containing protein [Nitrospirae bacterium]|nr:MAG: PEP-CTERM sorting domain-containing protein [Nitrospirota bacterium]
MTYFQAFSFVTDASITALNPPVSNGGTPAVPEPPTWLLLVSGLMVMGINWAALRLYGAESGGFG